MKPISEKGDEASEKLNGQGEGDGGELSDGLVSGVGPGGHT